MKETASNNDKPDGEYFDSVLTEYEIRCLQKNQVSRKATGPDGISYEILKNKVDKLVPPLIQQGQWLLFSRSIS